MWRSRSAFDNAAHERLLGSFADTQRGRHARRHQRRISQRSELDQPHAVRKLIDHVASHLERKARLAAAADPGQRQQARLGQQVLDLTGGGFTADQAGDR
jgi:hypothetical protein